MTNDTKFDGLELPLTIVSSTPFEAFYLPNIKFKIKKQEVYSESDDESNQFDTE